MKIKRLMPRDFNILAMIRGEALGGTRKIPNKKRVVKNSKRKHKGRTNEE